MSLYHGSWEIGKKKFHILGLYKPVKRCYNTLAFKSYAPVAQWIEHRIPVPRVGGSSPFRCTKKADTHLGVCFFAILGGRDSKNQMQQSGGLLLMPGSTGMTPSLPSIPGRQCKRSPTLQPKTREWHLPFPHFYCIRIRKLKCARMSVASDRLTGHTYTVL